MSSLFMPAFLARISSSWALGVNSVARGKIHSRKASNTASLAMVDPEVERTTGSTTTGTVVIVSDRIDAMDRATRASVSNPILIAPIPGSSSTAVRMASSIPEGSAGSMRTTPLSPCTVRAVTAHLTGTPSSWATRRSTCIPAAELLSDAEINNMGLISALIPDFKFHTP